MSRRVPQLGGSRIRTKHAGTARSVLASVAVFAVVLGALLYATQRPQPAQSARTAQVVKESSEASPASVAATTVLESQSNPAASTADNAPVAVAEAAAPNSHPQADRHALIQAQLESGEFGPAMKTAEDAADAAERTQLLKKVAQAQMSVRDFDAAGAAIRRMPDVEERQEMARENATRESQAGGEADFEPLIQLILKNTGDLTYGPWKTTHNEGAEDPEEFYTGISVDPHGLLADMTRQESADRLRSLGVRARQADLNKDMAAPSGLRLVSLKRLEQEAAARLADGKPVLETMKNLAGLSRIQYVFVYPESGEVVIGGPAEGWKYNMNGQPVGATSGRPTLQLDDFVTVLRTFSQGGSGLFSCLIVPREEGLKSVKELVDASQSRGALEPSVVRGWVAELQKRLGLQDVVVNGIPAESRVGRVIVQADYRMKMIGVGKVAGGPDIPSYFDILPKIGQTKSQNLDALRWWLTMKCDAVLHSPDRNVFEIQGSSVQCLSENEFITNQGKRVHTGKAEAANRMFAEAFTKHYAELAARDLIFADLQNIFDLSLVAALLQHEQLADRAGWDLGAFAAGQAYRPGSYLPARTVMSVVNHRVYNGQDIVVQVAGGVRGDLVSLIKDSNIAREAAQLADVATKGRAPQLPAGRWWWDAPR